MATSRPFAYNPTLITSGVSEQYGTLSVGFQDQPYGESPSGLKWWEGPDEDLGYCIGKSLPTGGRLGPDGIYGDVTFWRTQTLSDSQFITLANRITGQNFGSSLEAVTWLNANGYWTSYAGVPAPTPTPTAIPVIGAWSVGGALITARYYLAGSGTQTEGLAFGGTVAPGPIVSCTEEYDGTSWSLGGALITARYCLAGAGVQNAGLAFGGTGAGFNDVACTEEYNGCVWSSGGALITVRSGLAGAGTQNAGLAFGGDNGYPNTAGTCTEEYDGTSWSTGGALSISRYDLGGTGTQDAGLAFGGDNISSIFSCTEEYNGCVWSSGGALITARLSFAGAGTQNAGLAFGGSTGSPSNTRLSCTEEYNGTSWSAGGSLITARLGLSGAGLQNAGLAFGGVDSGNQVSCTEEYNDSPSVTPTPTGTQSVTPTQTSTPTSTTTSTPTPTSTIALTPTNTATPSPTPFPTIFTHGAVRATCSDFCTTNYNITTVTSASDTYAGLVIGDFIYGISGAGFIAYSNVSTNTTTGPFRIAQIDSNGEVIAIFICNGVTCEPL
jgi:hypothetical protein